MNGIEPLVKLRQLEQAVENSESPKFEAYLKLGHFESNLGFPSLGLADVLRAYALCNGTKVTPLALAKQSLTALLNEQIFDAKSFPNSETPFGLAAQLAEGLRLYTRDNILSRVESNDLTVREIRDTMTASLRCFIHAGGLIEKKREGTPAQHSWLYAHRGAALTMAYWLTTALERQDILSTLNGISKEELFAWAQKDFFKAIDYEKNAENSWCHQFLAFLLSIRADDNDFETATKELEKAQGTKQPISAPFERSKAILFLNLTKQSKPNRAKQAEKSFSASVKAMQEDPEDFVAAYFAAASCSVLVDENTDSARQRQTALAAVANARVRCENALSQAHACLIGLTVLDSHLNHESANARIHASHQCGQYLKILQDTKIDLETRIVFNAEFKRLSALSDVSDSMKLELDKFLGLFGTQTTCST